MSRIKVRALFAGAVLVALLVTGCGKSIPKTQANLTLCKVLAKVLDKQAPLTDLSAATFANNAPITKSLRQEVGTYVVQVRDNPSTSTATAAKAEADCMSIGAPVGKGF